MLDGLGQELPDIEQLADVAPARDQALELEQRRLVLRRDLRRLEQRRARLARVVHVLGADPRLLEQQIGALVVVPRVADLGVDQLDQVGPQRAAVEHAADRPQVRAQRRIEPERAAVRLGGTRLVGEPALVEFAELVRQHRGDAGIAGRLELARHRLGALLAARVAELVERAVEHRGRLEVGLERLVDDDVGDLGRDLHAAGDERGDVRARADHALEALAQRRQRRPRAPALAGRRDRVRPRRGRLLRPGLTVARRVRLGGRLSRQRRGRAGSSAYHQSGVGESLRGLRKRPRLPGLGGRLGPSVQPRRLGLTRRDRHRRRRHRQPRRRRCRRTRHQRRPRRAQRRRLHAGVARRHRHHRRTRRRKRRRRRHRRAKRQRRARRRDRRRLLDLLDLVDLERRFARLLLVGHHRIDARRERPRPLAELRQNSRIRRVIPGRAGVIFRWRSQVTRSSPDPAKRVNAGARHSRYLGLLRTLGRRRCAIHQP